VVFHVLRPLRRLRGTPLDIFGYAHVRRVERALPGKYLNAVDTMLEHLDASTYDRAVALCASPDSVRGYEEIKLRNVAEWRREVSELLSTLKPPGAEHG
jgi:indolepyruvate ferredoxin oxidoreductase